MGLKEAFDAYDRFRRLCPACQQAALRAGKRIETACHSGKHAKPVRGVVGPPP
jgi:hypothetical protein